METVFLISIITLFVWLFYLTAGYAVLRNKFYSLVNKLTDLKEDPNFQLLLDHLNLEIVEEGKKIVKKKV